ncbi:hypothetical protein GCM10009557_50010 [Virgisporangium ochraceum]
MLVEPYARNIALSTTGAVRVVGDALAVAGLTRHLPDSWTVSPAASVAAAGPDDLALLVYPAAAEVAAAHRTLGGGARLVVLIEPTATDEQVAEVLEAGPDTCVRAGSAAVLAGHLIACRRRTAGRDPLTLRMRNSRIPTRPLNAVHTR